MAFWGGLRVLLGGLGGLEAALGRVDAPKAGGPKIHGALGSVFGPILGAKRGPRRSPKRPKVDQKIVSKNDRILDRS